MILNIYIYIYKRATVKDKVNLLSHYELQYNKKDNMQTPFIRSDEGGISLLAENYLGRKA